MQIKLMLLLLLLRITGIKHFYDFSFKKDYSILYEKGKETRSRIFSYIEVLCVVTHPTSKFPSSAPAPLTRSRTRTCFFVEQYPAAGGGGIFNFRYVNLVLLPMLARPH